MGGSTVMISKTKHLDVMTLCCHFVVMNGGVNI